MNSPSTFMNIHHSDRKTTKQCFLKAEPFYDAPECIERCWRELWTLNLSRIWSTLPTQTASRLVALNFMPAFNLYPYQYCTRNFKYQYIDENEAICPARLTREQGCRSCSWAFRPDISISLIQICSEACASLI